MKRRQFAGLLAAAVAGLAKRATPHPTTVVAQTKEGLVGRFAIVAYTPKPGKEQQLIAAVKKHLQVLHAEQLVTDKPGYVMRAGDGTLVEVFEWRSAEAIKQAHTNPRVQALWGDFGAACDYTPLAKLKESHEMFAEFDAVSL